MPDYIIVDGDKNILEECEVSNFIQRPSMKISMPRLIFEQIENYLTQMWRDETRVKIDL